MEITLLGGLMAHHYCLIMSIALGPPFLVTIVFVRLYIFLIFGFLKKRSQNHCFFFLSNIELSRTEISSCCCYCKWVLALVYLGIRKSDFFLGPPFVIALCVAKHGSNFWVLFVVCFSLLEFDEKERDYLLFTPFLWII